MEKMMLPETTRRNFMTIASTAVISSPVAATTESAAQQVSDTAIRPVPCNLMPQQNATRSVLELAGLWDFQLDPDGLGERDGWVGRLPAPRLIAVPGSWNEQFQETRDYTGIAWYQTTVHIPRAWRGERIVLRVGSAVYHASVWLDGRPIGEHQGGHLPFAFEVTPTVVFDRAMTLVIRVENIALPTRVPPAGNSVPGRAANFPDINYDFFPYSGLHRAVTLYAVPRTHITDITVTPGLDGPDGLLRLRVAASDGFSGAGSAGAGGQTVPLTFNAGVAEAVLHIPAVQVWHPASPHLYDLVVTLGDAAAPADAYRLEVGVRTVEVRGDQLLLNGQPIQIRGASEHEDFPINGRGLNLPVAVRDMQLLKWIGGNSFRTSHYPYAEETMRLADREGILVINEIPAVKLYFGDSDANIEARLEQCRLAIKELIARDKNHACVIIWSLANEPTSNRFVNNGGADLPLNDDYKAKGRTFFETLFAYARSLDSTRPFTMTGMSATETSWLELSDVLCLNRYNGWYFRPGQPQAAGELLGPEIDALHGRLGKPMMITEFGADTLAGVHAEPPEMWSEEYQVALMMSVLDACASRPFVVGTQFWVLCDFKTAQAVGRAGGLNHKGVFTRDRRPKMAAHALRKRWLA